MSVMPEVFSATISFTTSACARSSKTPDASKSPATRTTSASSALPVCGTSGTGGNVPRVTAIEPPLAGNPSFTVGVSNALGGAPAVLVIDNSDPGIGPAIPATASFARLKVQLSGSGSGQGYGSASFLIPANSALIGTTLFGRWFVRDANAAGGVAVSPAFKSTIFGDAASEGPNPIDV